MFLTKKCLLIALAFTLIANAAQAASNSTVSSVTSGEHSSDIASSTEKIAKVKVASVNVRESGALDSKILGVLKHGERLYLLRGVIPADKWYKINYKGKTGLVRSWAVEFVEAEKIKKTKNKSMAKTLVPAKDQSKVSATPTMEIVLEPDAAEKQSRENELATKRIVDENKKLEAEVKKQTVEIARLNKAIDTKESELQSVSKEYSSAKKQLESMKMPPEAYFFSLVNAKGENAKLRGFGSIRIIPLQDDYLVVIPAEKAQQAEALFGKIHHKTVIPGKESIYVFCSKKYFSNAVPAPIAKRNNRNFQSSNQSSQMADM